tara:strand:- start:630 stop:3335 length:2706 start_codon:yes stop_codon:yes gene_type:complete
VFTVEEIKGLEYKNILVYRLLDSEIFHSANNLMKINEEKISVKLTDDKYGPAFNAFYTACTRATHSLVVLQDNQNTSAQHKLRYITNHFQPYAAKDIRKIKTVSANRNMIEQWYNEARLLLSNGNTDKARAIYINKLGKSRLEFDNFSRTILGEEILRTQEVVSVASTTPLVKTKRNKKKKKKNKNHTNKEIAIMTAGDLLPLCESETLTERDLAKLFTPLKSHDGECNFTLLFDIAHTRNIMLSVILYRHFSQISSHLTVDNLCRQSSKNGKTSSIASPLYWICSDESALSRLGCSESMVALFIHIANNRPTAFLETYSSKKRGNDRKSALYWLSCLDENYLFLSTILLDAPEFIDHITEEILFGEHFGIHTEKTSIFGNLLRGNGFDVLFKVLELSNGKFSGLDTNHFFPFVPANILPPIINLQKSKTWPYFIEYLEKHHASVIEILRDHSSIQATIWLDEFTQTKRSQYVTDINCIQSLLKKPTRRNIEMIFSAEKGGELLFSYPMEGNECLFVHLLDQAATRGDLLDYLIPKYAGKLKHHVTASALARLDTRNAKIPPLLWMMGSTKCSQVLDLWFSTNQRVLHGIHPDIFIQNISITDYAKSKLPRESCALYNEYYAPVITKGANLNAFYLAFLSEGGLALLPHIIKSSRIPVTDQLAWLATPCIRDVKAKETLTPLMVLARQISGHAIPAMAAFIFDCEASAANKLGDLLCVGLAISNNDFHGDSPLTELLKVDSGRRLLASLLDNPGLTPDSNLTKVLFHAFTKNLTSDSTSLKILVTIAESVELIQAAERYLKRHPTIIEAFDVALFKNSSFSSGSFATSSRSNKQVRHIFDSLIFPLFKQSAAGKSFITFIASKLIKFLEKKCDDEVKHRFFQPPDNNDQDNTQGYLPGNRK